MQTQKAARKVIQIDKKRPNGVDGKRQSFEQVTGASVERQSAHELNFLNSRRSQFQMMKSHNQYFSP